MTYVTELIKVTINGQEVRGRERSCPDRRVQRQRREHPFVLLLQGPRTAGLVPDVFGAHRKDAEAPDLLHDQMSLTAWSSRHAVPEIEKAQRSMGEFLLVNHPLDCPVCDRGGECELQEVIFDWGDVEERFTEKKNTQPGKISFADRRQRPAAVHPVQTLHACLQRVDGRGRDRSRKSRLKHCHRHLWRLARIARNAATVSRCARPARCSTAFTATKRGPGSSTRRSRPTLIAPTECSSRIGSRGGEVHRIVARDRYVNGLNGEFLDVKARFAHEFINHPDRIKTPLIRYSKGGKLIPATWDEAIDLVADKLSENTGFGRRYRQPAVDERIDLCTRASLPPMSCKTDRSCVADRDDMSAFFENLSAPLATHNDIRYAKTIVLIGGEPEEEQTYTAKQMRQAVRNGGAKLIVVNEIPINLARHATQFIHIDPRHIRRVRSGRVWRS